MSYYVIGEVNVKDDSWVPEYLKNVTRLVHRHGGTAVPISEEACWRSHDFPGYWTGRSAR